MVLSPKHRIYVNAGLSEGILVGLDPDRSRYLNRVLRMKLGDTLVCFNGDGYSYIAKVAEQDKKQLKLQIVSELSKPDPEEKQIRIHLVHALIKRPDKLLQKITELGVTDVWPILSQRSEVRLNEERSEQKAQHWQNMVIAACEQCGRNRIPTVHTIQPFTQLLNALPCSKVYILQPGAAVFTPHPNPHEVCLFVGPEGGWTDEEIEQANLQGITGVGLGQNILRADTAPLAALAILQHTWAWRYA